MKRIIILGGHGDGEIIASALADLQQYDNTLDPYGFLNDSVPKGHMIAGLPVLDCINNAHSFLDMDDTLFISALLKVKENHLRASKIKNLKIPIERFFTLIHPMASVARNSKIGFGTFIGPHVTVMPNATIGSHCSLRASANIGHDCKIDSFCYMGPNSTLAGRVVLEQGVHIGPNACIREKTTIGSFGVVGMGTVVIKDLPEFSVSFGNPAKIINYLSPS